MLAAVAVVASGLVVGGQAFPKQANAVGQEGEPDTTFTTSAIATSYAIAIQSNGNFVVGNTGSASTKSGFQMYESNGALITEVSRYSGAGYAVAIGASDKILVAGSASGDRVRTFTSAGGATSFTYTATPINLAQSWAVAEDSSGNVYAGTTVSPYLIRFSSTGTQDTTFNGNVALAGNIPTTKVNAIKVVGTGASTKIWVGHAGGIARYNLDGTKDSSFTQSVAPGTVLAIAPSASDGGVFVATNTAPYLRKYSSTGTYDSSFATNLGSTLSAQANAVDVTSAGDVVVGGTFTGKVKKIKADGTPDAAFNSAVESNIPSNVNGLAIQSTGNILVAHATGVLRLLGNALAPTAPPAPTATAGTSSDATISVTASAGATPSSFNITAVQDSSKSCVVTGASGQCTISGLTPGNSYTFTAVAINGDQTSSASTASNSVTIVDLTGPVFSSAAVDATGLKITLTYNEALGSTAPLASAFTVKNNSATVSVSSVAVSGNTVELTLGSPIGAGFTATVAYVAPASSATTSNTAIQDIYGNDAASLSSTTVAAGSQASTSDQTGPVYVSALVDSTGRNLTITYNETLFSNPPTTGSFVVTNAGLPVTVSNVTVSGATVTLALASAIGATKTVTVAYTAPASDPTTSNSAIQDASGNDAVTFSAKTLSGENNQSVVDQTAPTFSSASTDASGTTITLNFNEALSSTTAPASAFTVTNLNGYPVTVTSVSVSGTTVVLGLSGPVGAGKAVTVTYAPPSSVADDSNFAVQDIVGNDLSTISNGAVTNNSTADQTAPTWSSATTDSSGSTITISLSEALSATTAPASAFNVTNTGGYPVTVTGVSVNGSTVVLTLSGPVGAGKTVTVTYTAPLSTTDLTNSAVQDVFGNDLITQTSKSITNLSTADQTGPTVSAAVADSTGLTLTLTFNEALSATTAAASAFSVTNSGGYATTVSSVAVSGTTVILSLASPVGAGKTVTVSYVAPTAVIDTSNNAIQDVAGNDSVTITNRAVTNNSTVDQTAPTFTRSDVSSAGNTLTLTYNEALGSTTADPSAFSVTANDSVVQITNVAVSGSTVVLTLGTALEKQDVVKVSYTQQAIDIAPSNSSIQDVTGNDVLGIPLQAVTANNSAIDTRGPTKTAAAPVLSTNGLSITMAFDELLGTTTAPVSAFTVLVDGVAVTPATATVTGSTSNLVLTFSSAIGAGKTVTVAYSAPASDSATTDAAIQDTLGNNALSFNALAVTNGSTVDKTAPTLSLVSLPVVSSLGTAITLTYNETLSTTTAPASAYTVTVDGSPVTVTSATRSSTTTIVLSLPTAINGGQVVRVSYVAPTSDVLATNSAVQDTAGNDALSYTNLTINNNSTVGRPVVTGVTVGTGGNAFTINYNKSANQPQLANLQWYLNGELIPMTWGGSSSTSTLYVMYSPMSPVVTSRDVVTVSYTEPDTGATTLKSVAQMPVTNSSTIVDSTAPTLTSAVLGTDGKTLTLTYSESLAAATADVSTFSVLGDAVPYVVNTAVRSGSTIVLTLGASIPSGAAVSVDYLAPTIENLLRLNPAIQDGAGNDATSLSSQSVTNNSAQAPDSVGPKPTLVEYSGSTVTVTFDESLGSNIAASSAFSISAGIDLLTINSIALSGTNKLIFTLSAPIPAGQQISVGYEPPTNNPATTNSAVQDALGNDATLFSISNVQSNTGWSWADGTYTPMTSCSDLSATVGSNTFRQRTLPNGVTYSVGVSGDHQCIAGESESLSDRGATDAMFSAIGTVTEPGVFLGNNEPAVEECGPKAASITEYCDRPNEFVIIRFDEPVTNPTISFAGWGSSSSGTKSWTELRLVTPGLSLVQLPGTTPTSISLTENGTYLKPATTDPGTRCTSNAGCGSFKVPGTVSELKFAVKFAATGSNWGNLDAWNLIASVTEDFGFAPTSYDQGNAASHVYGPLRLGSTVTPDNLNYLYATTNGDAVAAGASIPAGEDGILSWPRVGDVGTSYSVDVVMSGVSNPAYLCGWIDFNGNGIFNIGERACSSGIAANDTTATLTWIVPNDAITGNTYARIRLSNDPVPLATGKVASGEVEDYRIAVELASLPLAEDDLSSGYLNQNQIISVLGNDISEANAPFNPATLFLCGTSETPVGCTQQTLTVSGEGTYTVNANGTVTFDPLPTYTGTATPVTYQISDTTSGTPLVAFATITPTVYDNPIAVNDTPSMGPYGVAQMIPILANDSPSSVLIASTLKLCNPDPDSDPLTADEQVSPNCSASSITTVDGTYEVSSTQPGYVKFTPASGFSGVVSDPPYYQVSDSVSGGTTVTAKITPSVAAYQAPAAGDICLADGTKTQLLTATSGTGTLSAVTGFSTTTSASNFGIQDRTSPANLLVNGDFTTEPSGLGSNNYYYIAPGGKTHDLTYYQANLSTGTNLITLLVGDTSNLSVGQAVAKLNTGNPAEPGALNASGVFVKTILSATEFTVADANGLDSNHAVSGLIRMTPKTAKSNVSINSPIPGWSSSGGGVDTYAIWTKLNPSTSPRNLLDPAVNGQSNGRVYFGNQIASSISPTPTFDANGFSTANYVINMGVNYGGTTDGTPSSPFGIDQSFGTVVGQNYRLHFSQGTENVQNFFGMSMVQISGYAPLYFQVVYGNKEYVIEFTATSTLTNLKFASWGHLPMATVGGIGAELVLDDVIVNSCDPSVVATVSTPTPTPTPSQTPTPTPTPSATSPPAAPNADPDTSTGPFNTAQSFDVVSNDDSFTGTAIQASTIKLWDPTTNGGLGDWVTTPVTLANGEYSIANGEIRFMPSDDFVGTAAPVTYQITDSLGFTDSSTYTPSVSSPAAPTATADSSSGFINVSQTKNLLTNDSAALGVDLNVASVKLCASGETTPACTATSVTVTGVGTYSVDNSGLMTFTPALNYTGTPAALPYIVKDQFNQVASSTYTPTVKSPPDAIDDTPAVGANDVNQVIDVLANDIKSPSTNAAFVPSTVKLCDPATTPAQVAPNCAATSLTTADGVYTVNSTTGVVTFNPDSDFAGVATEPVTYQVKDADNQVANAVITPSVLALPVAVDDTSSGAFNQPQTENVMADDSSNTGTALDPDLLKLCVSGTCSTSDVTVAGQGTYSIVNGQIKFTPALNYTGTADPVTYQVTDSAGQTDTATYTPTVNPPAGPTAVDDTSTGAYNTPQYALAVADDTSLTGTAIQGSTLKLCVNSVCSTADVVIAGEGTYSIVGGDIKFTPVLGFTGAATPVTYEIADSLGRTDTAIYTPTVSMPAGPTAVADTSSGWINQTQTENVVPDDISRTGTAIQASTLKLYDPAANSGAGAYVTTPVTLANGTYSIVGGQIQFVPTNNFVGTAAPVTYQIADSLGQTATTTYTPTIIAPPVATNDTPAIGANDVNQLIDVIANDTESPSTNAALDPTTVKLCNPDPDNNVATADGQVAPNCSATSLTTVDGTYTVNPTTGVVTFNPVSSLASVVAAPVTYQVSDADGQTVKAVITPTVAGLPVASNDTSTGAFNQPQSQTVLGNDSSNTGTALSASTIKLLDPATSQYGTSAVTIANQGTYTISGASIVFTPVNGYAGTPTPVTYQVTDSLSQSVTATYTPTISPPAPPIANPDTSTGAFNQPQSKNVVANDTSNTGTPVAASTVKLCVSGTCSTADVSVPGEGTYSINPDGSIEFTPVAGFTGPATGVTYEITDSVGQTATSTYTPTVALPAPPTAVNDTTSGFINVAQTKNLLTNDSAAAGDALNIASVKLCNVSASTPEVAPNCTATSVTVAGVGTYAVNASGVVTFTPVLNYVGTPAALPYIVKDTYNQVATATYTPTIEAPPVAVNDTPAQGANDVNQSINLLINDTKSPTTNAAFDPTTVKLCASNETAPDCTKTTLTTADGVYTVDPTTGVVTFNPDSDVVGTVTEPVRYQVADVQGQIVTAVLTPSVAGLPVVVNDTSIGAFNQPQTENVMADDSSNTGTALDPDLLELCVSGTCGTADVVVAGQGTYKLENGQITFTPELDYSGTATPVTYQVTDSLGQSVTATYTPTVNPPAGPTAVDDTSTGAYNTPQFALAVADDTSLTGTAIQGSTLKLCVNSVCSTSDVVVAGEGTYSIVGGDIKFTPELGFTGAATPVTYEIADSLGRTDTAIYTPTVSMPAGPTAVADTSSGWINQTQTENVVPDDVSRTGTAIQSSTIKLFDPTTSTYVTTPVTLANGTYSIVGGQIQFVPTNNFVGTAAPVTYQIADSLGQTATTTYTPTVISPPDAIDDTPAVGLHDTNQVIDVLANDLESPSTSAAFDATSVKLCNPDPDNNVATADGQVAPNCSATSLTTADGTYAVNPTTGVVTFDPTPALQGTVTVPVTYQVTDVDGQVVTAVITPSVVGPPTAVNDTSTGAFNQPQTEDVMADDRSYTGTALDPALLKLCVSGTCSTADVVVAGQGTYSIVNGEIKFTPELNYSGTATPVTYEVTDSMGQSVTATYTPTVNPPAGPNADPDTSTGAFNAAQSFDVVANDDSLTGTAIQASTIKLFDPAANSGAGAYVTTPVSVPQGTYSIVAGEIQFMPNNDYVGTADPVTYQIADSLGRTDTTTYTPTVPTPAGPTAQPDTTSDFINVVQTKNLLTNDSASRVDVDLNAASVKLCDVSASTPEVAPNCSATSVTVAGVGTYAVSNTGLMTFTPEANYTGTPAALPYTVEDQFGQEASSIYTPTVKSPPDALDDTPPVGLNDTNQTINVLTNDVKSPSTNAAFAPTTVKLCDPDANPAQVAPNCAATSLTTVDGVYTVNPTTGVVTFNPDADFTGVATEPVTYQVADVDGQVVSAVITPSVLALPVAVDDTSSGAFNQPQTENVMADDSSNTGTALSASTLKLCVLGTCGTADVVVDNQGTYKLDNGQITFTPELNYTGTADPVTYQVTDSAGQSVTATYTPTVNPPAGPNADPDTSTGAFNAAQSFDVVANDDSLTGTAIQASTIKLFDPAANLGAGAYVTTPVSVPQGTYSVVAGQIQFMPNNDYVGTADPVTYQIADSLGRTDTTTYTPTVPTPAGPTAQPDTTSNFINVVQTTNLLTNDSASRSDVDLNVASVKLCDVSASTPEVAPNCTATSVTVAGVGTYAVSNTGVMTYTPALNYTGTPTALPYTVEDQFGQEASSIYTPTVKSPPDAIDDTPAIGLNDVNQVINVLANDIESPSTSAAFDPTTVKLCATAQVAPNCNATTLTTADGVYSVNPTTGVVTFNPDADFTGVATEPASYQVADVDGQIVSAVITPSVVGLPVAIDDTSTGAFNQPQTEDVMADDSSNTGTPLNSNTLKLRNPSNGIFGTADVTIDGEGTYSIVSGQIKFTPVLNYTGTATPVTYQVTDSMNQSVTATYTPTVNPPAGPTAVDDTSTGPYNTAQAANAVADDISLTGTAIQGSTLKLCVNSVCSTSDVIVQNQGTYSLVNGDIQFMPVLGFTGAATPVTYEIADSLGRTDTAIYTPTVLMPAGPTAVPDTTSDWIDVPQFKTVVTNDTSNTGTAISASTVKLFDPSTSTYVTTPVALADGVYSIVSGQIRFVPDAGFTGTAAAVTYQIADSLGQTATTTYTPTVISPPDAINDTPATGAQDVNQVIDILGNDIVSPDTQAPFAPATVKLCNPASSPVQVAPLCTLTTLTTADGTYTVNPSTGAVTFDPVPSLAGVVTVPVSYQVADTDGQIVSAIITPSVVGMPVAVDDTSSGAFNQPQTENVMADDSSNTGTPLNSNTLKLRNPSTGLFGTSDVTISGEGTYSIVSGQIKFTPELNYSGTATAVTYQVTDSMGQSVTATYTPTVNPPVGPNADPDTSTGGFNVAQSFNVVANDDSLTGTAIQASTIKLFDPAANSGAGAYVTTPVSVPQGTYSIIAGEIQFMPNNDYVGTADPVTYQIADSLGRTDTTTYTPTVPTPAGPNADPDTTSGFIGAVQSINLLTNDEASRNDVDLNVASVKLCAAGETAPACTATTVTVSGVGTYAVSNTGVMTFTPTSTYTGTPAALPYTVEDQFGQEASSTFTPTVKSPPDALDDTPARGAHDVNQVIDVLANDIESPSTNAAFDPTSVKLCDPASSPAEVSPLCTATTLTTVDGVYSVDPSTGVVTFDPAPSLNTVVTVPVSYQVSDVDGQKVSAVITPSVVGLPTVTPDTTTGPFNQAQTKAVLTNDTPGAGTSFVSSSLKLRDPATSTFGTSPVTINNVGTYSISGSNIVFTPVNGYAGTPTPVTYQITDNFGASASTTYTPTIQPPAGPVATPDTSSGALNTAQLNTVVTNDTSSTGTAIAASSVKLFDPTANSGGGAFVTTPVTLADGVYSIVSGQVRFMPNTDFVGTAAPVTYQIEDSLGQLATTTYTPTVVMPAGPTASPDTTSGFKGVPQSINLTTNDSAVAGVTLNVASVKLCTGSETAPNCSATTVTVANVGTYVVASTGVITFTPTADFTGTPAALPYTVEDQFGQEASSTYTPTVNTPPTAIDDTPAVGLNDVNQVIDVLANDVKSTSTNAAFVPATVKLCAANQVAPNCITTSLTTADGVYTVNPTTGVVTFNPDADFTGIATEPVTYQVADADGQIVSAVITPSVVGLPTAAPDTSTGAFNEPQSQTVLTNDRSLTGTPLSASTLKLRNPSNGTFGTAPVTIANEGTYSISGSSIVFTPVTNYSGTATPVTYQVTDSMGQSVSTNYTPTVTAPAGLTADPETSVGTKNNSQTVDLLEGDSTSSSAISFVPSSIVLTCTVSTNCTVANNVVTVVNVGSFALDPQHPGFVIFTPVFNYVGSAPSVTYTVTDTLGRTVSETYSPTVLEGPVVSPDYSRGPADAPQSKNVLENDNIQGANLLPETLQLRHPTTQQLLAEPSVTLAGEGTFAFSGNTITFTPADDFVETILADRTRLVEVYEVNDDGAFVLDDNGDRIVIGLEATVPPIMYQLEDVNGRVVTASYTPRVYFPNPVAAPDYSRGPANAPQRQQVLGNDAATGTRLVPSTLKLIDPVTNQPVNSPTVPVAGEGTFRFEGDTITFTPDLDALVATLQADLVANGNSYQNSRLTPVYENGVYMGLEADITPISYKLQDEFGRWVTTTYYPKVFFPKPAAAPDVTRGAINQPQSKAIIMNDDPSTGVVFDNTYLKIWDYDTRAWVTSPVVTRDGTYTVEAADGVVLAAGLGGNKQILASSLTASGAYNLIVFTPVNNFVGTAIPIPYQIRDIFGQYVESTYTPTIETDIVATVARLARTGLAELGGFVQGAAALLLVAAGMVALRKRRHEEI